MHSDPLAALHYVVLTIRNYQDSGNQTNMWTPLATLSSLFDGLGRYQPAATVAGFGFVPFTAAAMPELGTTVAHLRDVLGDQTYETLARKVRR
jgi:hypothetical protein